MKIKIKKGGVVRWTERSAFERRYEKQGYEIVYDPQAKQEEEDSLQDKTVDELRQIAQGEGVTGYYSMNKGELIEALAGEG